MVWGWLLGNGAVLENPKPFDERQQLHLVQLLERSKLSVCPHGRLVSECESVVEVGQRRYIPRATCQ
jgi:hypothetical protein